VVERTITVEPAPESAIAVDEPGPLGRAAQRFTELSERYVPDAFVFALAATVIVFFAGWLAAGASPGEVVDAWGRGFWELISFTLQMALVIITGSVLASTGPVRGFIRAVAARPRTPRGAVALVTLFAMASAWLNWGFSLIFSAVLAKEVARRVRGVDYRALAAASFLGLGSVWAQGLSGSAALQMATRGALSPKIREIVAAGGVVPDGIVSFRHTIFLWQSLVTVSIEVGLVTLIMWLATPPAGRARTAEDLGIDLTEAEAASGNGDSAPPRSVGEWLERSPILNYAVVALGAAYLIRYFRGSSEGLYALNINTLNLGFLVLGFALHRTPARLMNAVRESTPAVWGVILQFPFYAGIAGIITYTHLNERIAHWFAQVSTATSFPAVIALYSAVLGVFVPSGGSKWIIEAPYVMAAAHQLKAHLGWMVAVYDLGEALANLVQPFWMLPTLAFFGLRARDVMGYTFVVFLLLAPVVLVMVTLLGLTLHYPL
jgi:short-chain fatty acids transporter